MPRSSSLEPPPRLPFNMRHVRAYTAVAKELHFGRAARALNMSESALSRLVRSLEESIGTPLLVRTTRSVRMNEAGRAFLAECELAHGHLARAANAAVAAAEGRAGTLRVGYMDFAINGALPTILLQFAERVPGVRIELVYAPSSGQRLALLEGRIDIGFLVGELVAQNAENVVLWSDSHVALLPERHRLASKDAIRMSDLAAERFVLGTADQFGAYRPLVFELCRNAGFFPTIVQEASNSTGIFGMVAAGAGVTLYGGCARNILRSGIVVRPLLDVKQQIPIIASWFTDNQSPALSSFVKFLLASRRPARRVPAKLP